MAVGFMGTDFQAELSIMDPFRTMFCVLGPIENQVWAKLGPEPPTRDPEPNFKSAAVAASASQVRTLEPSRPLSRPPGVGSTWSMVWNVDHRTARSSPTRPADSGTFFWAPFRNFFSAKCIKFRRVSGVDII